MNKYVIVTNSGAIYPTYMNSTISGMSELKIYSDEKQLPTNGMICKIIGYENYKHHTDIMVYGIENVVTYNQFIIGLGGIQDAPEVIQNDQDAIAYNKLLNL